MKRFKGESEFMFHALALFTNETCREQQFEQLRAKLTYQAQKQQMEDIIRPVFNPEVAISSTAPVPKLGNVVFLFLFMYFFQDQIYHEKAIFSENLKVDREMYLSWMESIFARDVDSFSFDECLWLADKVSSCFTNGEMTLSSIIKQYNDRSFTSTRYLKLRCIPFIISGPAGILGFHRFVELVYLHHRKTGYSFVPMCLNPWVMEGPIAHGGDLTSSNKFFDHDDFHAYFLVRHLGTFDLHLLDPYYDACQGSDFKCRMFNAVVWYYLNENTDNLQFVEQIFGTIDQVFQKVDPQDIKFVFKYILSASDINDCLPQKKDLDALKQKYFDAAENIYRIRTIGLRDKTPHGVKEKSIALQKKTKGILNSFSVDYFVPFLELVDLQD